MSARPASSVEHASAFDEPQRPLSEPAENNTRVVDERKAGLIASIRNGLLSLSDLFSRYRSTMDEVNAWNQDVWNSGRPGMATGAEALVSLSTTAEIFSEADELLTEATVREDANGRAMLRLDTSKTLPQRVVVRSSADDAGRMATVKWTSGASAIIEFD
jgi:hypothetical protein